MRTMKGKLCTLSATVSGCALGLSLAATGDAVAADLVWTPALDSLSGQCTVTNASERDLQVSIRILDRTGRSETPGVPVPIITQISTGEVVEDDDGFPLTFLDVVLPPGGSDGIRRERLPAGSLAPPTSCRVDAGRSRAARVIYCELVPPEFVTGACVQAP